ncbi:MAG: hypothetical protein ABIT01_20250 [Thermoanaerobaculia bacterium]
MNETVHSTSVNNNRFTVPTGGGGFYDITGQVSFVNNTNGNRMIRIIKNGNVVIAGSFHQTTIGFDVFQSQVTAKAALNAGDYVTFNVYQNSGGTLNTIGGSGNTFGSVTKLW